ncbi:hypothetical protein JCM10369A_32400 [Nocardioides pyridinolyticus]
MQPVVDALTVLGGVATRSSLVRLTSRAEVDRALRRARTGRGRRPGVSRVARGEAANAFNRRNCAASAAGTAPGSPFPRNCAASAARTAPESPLPRNCAGTSAGAGTGTGRKCSLPAIALHAPGLRVEPEVLIRPDDQSPRRQPASRLTAASTRSSVAVNATRTWRLPAEP